MKDYRIPTRCGAEINARTYRPARTGLHQPLPIFVYFHGGGFVFGTLDSEDAFCSRIINAGLDIVIVNVCYRHTPDHTYPTPWTDAEDAVHWVFDHAEDFAGKSECIIVGGTSAGAYMTASLTLGQKLGRLLRGRPQLMGQVLMIPCVVQEPCYQGVGDTLQNPSMSSYEENEFAPILPLARLRLFNSLLGLSEVIDPSDRMLNPGLATTSEVQGLPPTVMGVAGLDPLRDEGLLFARKLDGAGLLSITASWFKSLANSSVECPRKSRFSKEFLTVFDVLVTV